MMEDGDGSHVRSCNKQAWLDSKSRSLIVSALFGALLTTT
jgi:hypothetical protein